jgi:L-ascorbate metabolism protein UlaG (beta-lactamase superfamily)
LPVNPADLNAAQVPMAVPGGVNVHWYGHGFIYLTSSVGIRAAIDPFGPETVHYKFPDHLAADFVLVTHEAEDHCAADLIFGNPQIFRSVMAVGLDRANGIPFYGVGLQKDPSGEGGANTAFTLSFDGVKFCYLGQINLPLLAEEKEELGHADVVFLPVGLETLSVGDFNEIVKDLGATIVIPINYKTDLSGIVPLRTLDEYLSATKFPVHKFDSDEIVVSRSMLPTEPTLYILKSPMDAAPEPPPEPMSQ